MSDAIERQDLIDDTLIAAVLQSNKGAKATLKNWIIQDLSQKGDGFASLMTCVKVFYSVNEENFLSSYIVKTAPSSGNLEDLVEAIFEKESKFYLDFLPRLNRKLAEAGQVCLRVPRCFYASSVRGSEVIVLEDLREREFKMHDRKIGLTVAQTVLVLQELARLHAASIILQADNLKANEHFDMKVTFPFLKEIMTGENLKGDFMQVLVSLIEQGAELAAKTPGYENAIRWLKKQDIKSLFEQQLQTKPPFQAICHGNCWTNNVLFRYDENGCPVEVCLIDFQLVRYASPTTDLNYFLHTSLTGVERRRHLQTLLAAYNAGVNVVLAGRLLPEAFSWAQLQAEYKARNMFGLLCCLMDAPNMLQRSKDVPDFADLQGSMYFPNVGDMQENEDVPDVGELHRSEDVPDVANLQEERLEKFVEDELVRTRFLDSIDDLTENRSLFDCA